MSKAEFIKRLGAHRTGSLQPYGRPRAAERPFQSTSGARLQHAQKVGSLECQKRQTGKCEIRTK